MRTVKPAGASEWSLTAGRGPGAGGGAVTLEGAVAWGGCDLGRGSMSLGGAGASRQPHGLDSRGHVERGQSAGFSAGSGSWQGPCSGSSGPPARVFGPHFTCCWNLTAVSVRMGLQPLGVSLVKLGAPHGLVQLPLGSDRVGTGRFGRSTALVSAQAQAGWTRSWEMEQESRKPAWGSTPVPCSPPPSSCGEALPRCG